MLQSTRTPPPPPAAGTAGGAALRMTLLLLLCCALVAARLHGASATTAGASPSFGSVLFVCSADAFHAFDALNGTQLWSASPMDPVYHTVDCEFPPAISADGRLFFSAYKTVHCYTIDGQHLWNHTVYPPPGHPTPTVGVERWGSNFLQPMLSPNGEALYVNHCYDGLYAFNTSDGVIMWLFNATAQVGPVASAPAVATDGTIYISANQVLYALYPNNGSIMWQLSLGVNNIGEGVTVSPVDGTIYLFLDGGWLAAVTKAGKKKWLMRAADLERYGVNNYISTPILDRNGTIHVVGEQQVAAVYPNGTMKWNVSSSLCLFPTCDAFNGVAPTLAANGTIFLSSYAEWEGVLFQNLTALYPNGTFKWVYDFNNQSNSFISGDPVVDGSGTTVYYSNQDYLVALDIDTGAQKWIVSGDYSASGMLCPCPPPMDFGRMLMACWLNQQQVEVEVKE